MKGDVRERPIQQEQLTESLPTGTAAHAADTGHAQERLAGQRRDSMGYDSTVYGERGATTVNRSQSIQSRISSLLAAALMMIIGVGMLAWYYTHAFEKQSQLREDTRAATASRAQAEMPLPPFGRIDAPPLTSATTAQVGACTATADELPESSLAPPLTTQARAWNANAMPAWSDLPPGGYGSVIEKTPAELALERRLSGVVFVRAPQSPGLDDHRTGGAATATIAAIDASSSTATRAMGDDMTAHGTDESALGGDQYFAASMNDSGNVSGNASGNGAGSAQGRTPGATSLAVLLQPRVTAAVGARVLPTRRLLLAKGAFIDCTLETAIDSTLPGMATCITATDTFGVDGKVVLLERGTKLVGETRGQVQQGAARVFVLWSEARTPTGVVVPLSSPAADELGRAGLPGKVNRHFLDRFGAAMLISVIDGAVQAAVQSRRTSGAVIYDPAASRDVLTEVLRSSVNIAPTVVKQHGDRIQVLVARDLDFRSVYELRIATPAATPAATTER